MELTNSALGVFKGANGLYFVCRIKYNPVTKETGELEVLSEGDVRVITEEKFKILTIKEGII